MNNYIYTNCQLILDKIYFIKSKSIKHDKLNTCPLCKKIFKKIYERNDIKIHEYKIHLLSEHNLINKFFYQQILEYNISNYPISWCVMNSNSINIIDGLYESGSKSVYIKTNNFYGKKIFSEHAGFICFKNNKIDKITVLTDNRIDKNDPIGKQP